MKSFLNHSNFVFATLSWPFALFLCASLTGCAPNQISNPTYNDHALYDAPQELTSKTAATLVGSQDIVQNPLSSNWTIYLRSIDDKPVINGWRGWNQPVLLSPGEHYIEFVECGCSLFVNGWAGNVDVEIVVKAGETYTLNASVPVQNHLLAPDSADGWVADSSGNLISRIVDDNGNLVSKKEHFFLNPQSGGPDTVPIFLPTK